MVHRSHACLRAIMDTAKNSVVFEHDAYYECIGHVATMEKLNTPWCYKPLFMPESESEKTAVAKVSEKITSMITQKLEHA